MQGVLYFYYFDIYFYEDPAKMYRWQSISSKFSRLFFLTALFPLSAEWLEDLTFYSGSNFANIGFWRYIFLCFFISHWKAMQGIETLV